MDANSLGFSSAASEELEMCSSLKQGLPWLCGLIIHFYLALMVTFKFSMPFIANTNHRLYLNDSMKLLQ